MTDTTETSAQAETVENNGAGIRVVAQYIRDLSFENPNAPDSLRGGAQPEIDMGVEMNARGREDGMFEVDLKLTARATREGQTVFHVEVVQGGLFAIEGVPQEALEQVLLIECPRYLFPFARRVVADLTGEGGFPPFLIDPIDFAGVYAARKMQEQAATTGQVGNA